MRFIDEKIRIKFSLGRYGSKLIPTIVMPEEWTEYAYISLKAYIKKFNISYKPDFVGNQVQQISDYYQKLENSITFEIDVLAEDEKEAVLNYYNLHLLSKGVAPKEQNGAKIQSPNLKILFDGMPYIFKYLGSDNKIHYTNIPLTLVTNFSYSIDLDKGMTQMKMRIGEETKEMLIPNAFSLSIDAKVIKYQADLTVEQSEMSFFEQTKNSFLNSVGSRQRQLLIGNYDFCNSTNDIGLKKPVSKPENKSFVRDTVSTPQQDEASTQDEKLNKISEAIRNLNLPTQDIVPFNQYLLDKNDIETYLEYYYKQFKKSQGN